MVLPDHLCPSGLKARDLLRRQGFQIEDHPLTTRAETDAFKASHQVATTPQIFIGGERVGGPTCGATSARPTPTPRP
jgi:glutaredoxin